MENIGVEQRGLVDGGMQDGYSHLVFVFSDARHYHPEDLTRFDVEHVPRYEVERMKLVGVSTWV